MPTIEIISTDYIGIPLTNTTSRRFVSLRPIHWDKIKIKERVFNRDGSNCSICGKNFKYNKLTLDHIIPLSIGGDNDLFNLQLVCEKCEFKKQQHDIILYKWYMNNYTLIKYISLNTHVWVDELGKYVRKRYLPLVRKQLSERTIPILTN